MPKLSPIGGKDLIKKLGKVGFIVVRQKGSHVRLAHQDGRRTSIPVHSGENVYQGLLKQILKDIGITPEAYLKIK